MKIISYIVILLFCASIPSLLAQTDTLPNDIGDTISTAEGVKSAIDSKDSRFVIVDVRNDTAYGRGHIESAINIPGGWISDIKNPPPKDKYLILYCGMGLTSPAAGERLIAEGYQYIFVWGGISDWPYKLVASE